MKMYVAQFGKDGIRDLRPRIDYTRYEGYGLIDSVDGEIAEGDVLYIGAISKGITAITKDLEWAKKNAIRSSDISKIIYKKNVFLPYEDVEV
jgi:hypothetical protein|nr:MAG TPA: hypothetical protein [Caudoviricetes sp.]